MPPPEKGLHLKGLRGFTLAEVLITLGIIGVVAALTLPAVITNTQNKERQEALKKAYSVLQQALLLYQKDTGENITPSTFNTKGVSLKKAILPYFNGAIDCGSNIADTECLYNSRSVTYMDYNNKYKLSFALLDDGQYIVTDGMMYFFENENLGTPDTPRDVFIFVDVNGFNKKPNQLGRDLFVFELIKNGKLLPMGADGTKYNENVYCTKTNPTTINGIACTNKALYDASFWKGKI